MRRKRAGAIVSYDLNYRPSLWKSIGGQTKAQQTNRRLAPLVDVMLGNEEDFTAALGFKVAGLDEHHSKLDPTCFKANDRKSGTRFSPHYAGHRYDSAACEDCDRE